MQVTDGWMRAAVYSRLLWMSGGDPGVSVTSIRRTTGGGYAITLEAKPKPEKPPAPEPQP
jgi:hypothetical protein